MEACCTRPRPWPAPARRLAAALGGAALFAVGLVGCRPVASPPVLDEVSPTWGWRGEPTILTLHGDGFFPDVVVDGQGGSLDDDFRVILGTAPGTNLGRVERLDFETLTAEVPAGLDVGSYAVHVITPGGQEAHLDDAFEVRGTRADRLVLSTSAVAHDVYDPARVDLAFYDPLGGLYTEPAVVEVRVVPIDGAAGARFDLSSVTGLGEATLEDGDAALTGVLSGTASFSFTTGNPGTVRVEAAALGEAIDAEPLLVSFAAGSASSLSVALAEEDGVVRAGDDVVFDVTLYDDQGNVLSKVDPPLDVAIEGAEGCGDPDVSTWELTGSGPQVLHFDRACPANVLHVYDLGDLDAWSEPFDVVAGDPDHLAVRVSPPQVVAGDVIAVTIQVMDAWENPVEALTAASPLVEDDLGGLSSTTGVGSVSCSQVIEGEALCLARPERAGELDRVRAALADSSLTGTSDAFRVLAGPASALELTVLAPADADGLVVEAGEGFDLDLLVTDSFGNPANLDVETALVRADDETGTLDCGELAPSGDHWTLPCTLTEVTAATFVAVSLNSLADVADEPVRVRNGPLATLLLELSGVPTTAGTAFALRLQGEDAWGNPFVEDAGDGTVVSLSDSTGTLTPGSADLAGAAALYVDGVVTRAAPAVTVSAAQGGVRVTSDPFAVGAGALAALRLGLAPWVDIDAPAELSVTAVDAWENPVPDYAGPVSVSATESYCEDFVLTDFAEGVATGTLVCDTPGLEEEIVAGDGALEARQAIDVLDFGCAAGPAAALALDGGDEAVACLADGGVDVLADASGSTAADGLAVLHFADSDGYALRTAATVTTLHYEARGSAEVSVVVVDGDTCAASASGWVYVGEDDGRPVGPLTVATTASSVPTSGTTTVNVAATTCTGDVASRSSVFVQADLGSPGGTATGGGLSLALDARGRGSLTWEMPPERGGTATVRVGDADGAAYGEASVTVTNDRVHPRVALVSPTGLRDEPVDTLTVTFTEAVLEGWSTDDSATWPLAFTLDGDDLVVDGAFALSDDGLELTFTPETPIQSTLGAWGLSVVAANVRDVSGLRLWGDPLLNGEYDFQTGFGLVASTVPADWGCEADTSSFQPDGDDGAGVEADEVQLLPAGGAMAPDLWRLDVYDADGVRRRSAWADGADTRISWDGRGDDGRVLGPDPYLLLLHALDDQGNERVACEISVTLAAAVDRR